MPTFDDLQAILEALYESEVAEPSERAAHMRRYEELVSKALREINCTRFTFVEAIQARYKDYRRDRLRQERQGRR